MRLLVSIAKVYVFTMWVYFKQVLLTRQVVCPWSD